MKRLSLRNNRLRLETSGGLPIILEESIEYISNEWKQNWNMSTCHQLDLESLGSWPTMPKIFPGTGSHCLVLCKSPQVVKCLEFCAGRSHLSWSWSCSSRQGMQMGSHKSKSGGLVPKDSVTSEWLEMVCLASRQYMYISLNNKHKAIMSSASVLIFLPFLCASIMSACAADLWRC